jgi:probable F420-dependent oxidoreductase
VTRPFRFGLIVETRQTTRQDLLDLARRAEDAGCSILLGTDHFGRLSALPLLQAAAETTSLRIGSLVLNNDFRHPVVLAQELATIDMITEGRLEIGLGAGWDRPEYEAAGMTFDRPGLRVQRMMATVELLKQALGEGRMERAGDEAYPAMHMADMPRSIQRPHPPILIGGGGRRVLSFAAREADIVALDPKALPEGGHDPSDVRAAAIDAKIGWIREAAGDRWPGLEINVIVFDVDPDFRRRSGPPPERSHGISDEEMPLSPHYLTGDAEEMIDQLQARRDRWGISYLALRPAHLDAVAQVVTRLAGS